MTNNEEPIATGLTMEKLLQIKRMMDEWERTAPKPTYFVNTYRRWRSFFTRRQMRHMLRSGIMRYHYDGLIEKDNELMDRPFYRKSGDLWHYHFED